MGLDLERSSSQYADIGLSLAALNGVAAAAFACWVKLESAAGTMGLMSFSIGPPPGSSSIGRMTVEIRSSRRIQIVARADDSSGISNLGTLALTLGVWHHVVGIVDIANDISEIYIDGALDAAFTPSYGPSAFLSSNSKIGALGGRSDGSSELLDGVIADARVYAGTPRVTAVEVKEMFHGRGKLRPLRNLQHRWLLNERTSGTTASGVGTLKDEGFRQRNAEPKASPVYAETELSPRRRVS